MKFVNWDRHYVNESYHHIVFLDVKRIPEARLALILINTLEFALSDMFILEICSMTDTKCSLTTFVVGLVKFQWILQSIKHVQ